jgi:hypothetical protein
MWKVNRRWMPSDGKSKGQAKINSTPWLGKITSFLTTVIATILTTSESKFISYLDMFFFDLTEWYCQHQWTDSDTKNYRSVWRQTHYDDTDKNNNDSFEGLDIHYH